MTPLALQASFPLVVSDLPLGLWRGEPEVRGSCCGFCLCTEPSYVPDQEPAPQLPGGKAPGGY